MNERRRLRLPLVVVPLVLGAAYLWRSLAMRNGDFRVDVRDTILLAIVTVVAAFVAWARISQRRKGGDADSASPPTNEQRGD